MHFQFEDPKGFEKFFFQRKSRFSFIFSPQQWSLIHGKTYGKAERTKRSLGFIEGNYRLFLKQCFFTAQSRCCLTFSILRYILNLVYLCPCLGLCLFMSYIRNLFFILSLVFVVINHIMSLKQTHLFFVHFLEYPLFILNNFQIVNIQTQGLA